MTADFFRNRLDQMIDLRHPLAVLANRMPRKELATSLPHRFARRLRAGILGHLKADRRLNHCQLKGAQIYRLHAVLCAALVGSNGRVGIETVQVPSAEKR